MKSLSQPQAKVETSGPYVVLTLVSTAHAMTHMYVALLPLTFPFIIAEFGVNYTLLGIMMGITSLVSGVLQFAFGYINRYFASRVLLGGGNLLLGLSMVWGGWAGNFVQYATARWTAALAMSPQHPVGNAMIADRFGQKGRGLALAVNFAGGNAGTLAVPIAAAFLIGALGWRQTMLVLALPCLVVGLLVMTLIRESGPVRGPGDPPGPRLAKLVAEIRNLFCSRTIALLITASLIAAGGRGLGIVLNFFPPYLSDPQTGGLGLPPETAAYLYTLLLLGSVFGPLALGRISDRLGVRKPVVIAAYLVAAITALLLAGAPLEGWLLPVVILTFGLTVFSESPLIQSFLADLVRAGSRDVMFGTYFALSHGVSSLWVVLQGWLVDSYGFGAMFAAMAASYLIAAVFVLGTREQAG